MSFEHGTFIPEDNPRRRGSRGGSRGSPRSRGDWRSEGSWRDRGRNNWRGSGHTNGQRFYHGNQEIPPLMDNEEDEEAFNFNPNAPEFTPNNGRVGVGVVDGKDKNVSGHANDKSESSSPERNGNMEGKDNEKKPELRNQRERLSDQLKRNVYDCMICVEKVRKSQYIWSCSKCYNIFHLNCIITWGNSSADDVGWRCPGCQSYCDIIPTEYRCFCEKKKNPSGVRVDVPHTCGQMCGKKGPGGINCCHHCSISCHPGPCPPCDAIMARQCCCGRMTVQVKCSSKAVLTCSGICDKLLNCGISAHRCTKQCHAGPCDPCAVLVNLVCHCKKQSVRLQCDAETSQTSSFSCLWNCDKELSCGNHTCKEKCHAGPCLPCKFSPEAVLSCPCGQTPVDKACSTNGLPIRKSCLDRIPICGKQCSRILACGNGKEHKCQSTCHLDPKCPPCPFQTDVKCRCGSKTFEIKCSIFEPNKEYCCEKRCTKKRMCGKHKCNQRCCIDFDHICPIICDRGLRCGNHKCSLLCHNGHCPPCRNVSFDELSCECGASVIYPPVSCGTKKPPCNQPCTRIHDCDHPVMHNCHSEPQCPPCTYLTEKWCYGKHELRKNVMCHIKELSCGLSCKRLLDCRRHVCIRTCHSSLCLEEGASCMLPCEIPKPECGHKCGAPCHGGNCPELKCKVVTEAACPCGRKQENMICWKREKEYDRVVTYATNIELKRLRESSESAETGMVDFDTLLASIKLKTPKINVLECDKECARVERNRKMMDALQLEDPDATSTFGTPNYSEYLLTYAKKNPQFVENSHDRLTNLVVKAKRSKRKNETYAFEAMNRDKRKFVHEYSDHFGCISQSFDEEPNRHIICIASKDKSYLPTVSLIDAVFRPNLCSERKNAFNDVEIFHNSKSQIMKPANGKIWSSTPSTIGTKPPVVTLPTSSSSSASTTNNSYSTIFPALGGDFPPLS